MHPDLDCAVIGGGAAGLAAAIFIRRWNPQASVAILEKGPRVGKKLSVTGNGTCNLTNLRADSSHYHGADPAFVLPALAAFPPAEACSFFSSIGVECCEREEGRVYPLCLQASAVLDCLRTEARALGAEECCATEVSAIRPIDGAFRMKLAQTELCARKVVVAVGGAAAPAQGGSASGYGLLTALGHTKTPLFPSIVQLTTDTAYVRAVSGVRIDGGVSLSLDGRRLGSAQGDVLFTEYGLSGPAVMQLSRFAGDWERTKRGAMSAHLDLLPTIAPDDLRLLLAGRRHLPGRLLEDYLTGLVQKRLGQTVLRAAGIGPLSRPADSLTSREVACVAAMLKDWPISVTGTRGMGGAQVTAGGISTAETDPRTMESRKAPGLFLAGEVLDIDGDCGGYNLHWAWASAHAAASGVCLSLA